MFQPLHTHNSFSCLADVSWRGTQYGALKMTLFVNPSEVCVSEKKDECYTTAKQCIALIVRKLLCRYVLSYQE